MYGNLGAVNTWLPGTSALELAQNGVVFTFSSRYVTVYIASSVRRYSAANIKKGSGLFQNYKNGVGSTLAQAP